MTNKSTIALWVDGFLWNHVLKTSNLKENCFLLYFLPNKWHNTIFWTAIGLVMKVNEFKLYYSKDIH